MDNSDINAFCENKGWLFEDLKKHFQELGVSISDKPVSSKEAFICIRSSEFIVSPRYDRTIVQIHDLKPPKNISIYESACGLSFMHPIQEWYWRKSGYRGISLTQPIGARDTISLPQDLPENPTVGFFCGEDKFFNKGSPLFAKAVDIARSRMSFDCLLIGRGLEHIAYLGKYETHAAEPKDYARIDVLICASKSPAIPLSFYEALAAGKPVISTPRWVLSSNLPAVCFVNNADDMANSICWVLKRRSENFCIRKSLMWRKYLLSDWLKSNIEFTKETVIRYYNNL